MSFERRQAENAQRNQLYWSCREMIKERGNELLDPNRNIGHSLENGSNQDKRVYIDDSRVGMVLEGKIWAIEPHIGQNGYGAKFKDVISLLICDGVWFGWYGVSD